MTDSIVPVLSRNNISIEFTKDRPISLTQLWKMAGSPIDQTPAHWKRLASTQKIVTRVSQEQNMLKSHVIESDGDGHLMTPQKTSEYEYSQIMGKYPLVGY